MKPTTTLPLLALIALFAAAPATAQVPSILNYQGRVTVGGTNFNGTGRFKFALVNGNGTAVYWKNDGTTTTSEPASAVPVDVTQGLYSTLLGDTSLSNMAALPSSVFTNTNVNLRVWFWPGGTNAFLRLSPDQRIGAVGYALRAAAADSASTTNAPGDFTVAGILYAAQIVGGNGASAGGLHSVVAGGLNNAATNTGSAVLGGEANQSWGLYSFVGAGLSNRAAGTYSVVAGGSANAASGSAVGGTIGGGQGNRVASFYTVVGGGFFNQANGDTATVAGGQENIAGGSYSSVGGGITNTASGDYATVGGGGNNTASERNTTIAGGLENTASGMHSTIGGGVENTASGGFATVGGGLRNIAVGYTSATVGGGADNLARGDFATVGGGADNLAGGTYATVGGGYTNTASIYATVGGGVANLAGSYYATVGGGASNTVGSSADYGTVGGGVANSAGGDYATVGGGRSNTASGTYATVPGGTRGQATNNGAFVWSGVDTVDTVSTNTNSFTVRAPGGARFLSTTATNSFVGVILTNAATAWASLSDSNSKTDFETVKPREILSKVAAMPVTSWHYKHDLRRRYIGPMAQDFHAAFGLGSDDKTISTLDSDGVMYAAIQGLVEELKERDKTIGELKAKLEAVEHRLNTLPPAP